MGTEGMSKERYGTHGDPAVGTDAPEYTVCDTCWSYEEPHILGVNDGVCETCRLEPPTDEACPDCKAEVGEPCTWACSSRWT